MFEYAPPVLPPSDGRTPTLKSVGPALPSAAMAFEAVMRRKTTVLACLMLGGALGWVATKVITPRYVATTQIYIDPGNLPGAEKEALAPGQDSNGFINFVESQGLIITSRQVLQKVVANERLDADPEFADASRGVFFSAKPPSETELSDSATLALGSRIQIRRPERTFIIDLSASDKDPLKAARLANATAQAYIQVSASMQRDAATRAEASLSERLVALRERVIAAENAVEAYKTEKGLIGTRDQLVSEQQLKELTTQMMAARARATDARAQIDAIEANKIPSPSNIAALASQLNSAALASLRTQQAANHDQLANLEADLGPRHPQVIEARARANASDRAVVDELGRIAQSQRIEWQRAKQIEETLGKQLEALKSESTSNGESSVGLRDLERQAEAARGVYELFVTRSRESGEIQQVEPSRTHVISLATAPKQRAFPPGATVMAGAGALFGTLAGLLLALGQQGLLSSARLVRRPNEDAAAPAISAADTPRPDAPPEDVATLKTPAEPPRDFVISRGTLVESLEWSQNIDCLDLTGLGIPTAARRKDMAEFGEILDALSADLGEDVTRPLTVAVVGPNRANARTSLALNLALAAAARGARVALFDAADRHAALTRAVRRASATRHFTRSPFYRTLEDITLAIPKVAAPDSARDSPAGMLAHFAEERMELVICDGPNLDRFREDNQLGNIDVILVQNDADAPEAMRDLLASLESFGLLERASLVHFDPTLREATRRAEARV